MTATTAERPALRAMSDEQLAALYASDEAAARAVLAECGRRDRIARLQEAQRRIYAEWYDAARAQYAAADIQCRGELVNNAPGWPTAKGDQPGRDDFALWTLPEREAMRFATEELKDFWLANPRLSFRQWQRNRAAGEREAPCEPVSDEDLAAWACESGPAGLAGIVTEVTGDERFAEHAAECAVVDVAAEAGHRRERAADPVRPGRDGQQHAGAEAGRVRDSGPVQHGRGMINFGQVAPLDTLLLSQRPYLPYGEVSLFYGSGSLGKGRMVQSIIAAVTNGEPVGLDTSTEDEAGDVIAILPEDKQGESAVKRLIAAGARLERVWDMTRAADGSRFKLSALPGRPGHLPELRAAVEYLRAQGRNPRLVVIDPLGACIGEGTILTSRGARYLVESLQDFAESAGVCVIVVAHPVSGGKLQGSWALEQALRSVFRISRDEADPELRVLSSVKGNDVPPELAADIRFTVTDGPQGPRAQWVTGRQATPEPGRPAAAGWRDELAARRQARKGGTAPGPLPGTVPVSAPLLFNAFMAPVGGQAVKLAVPGPLHEVMGKCEVKAGQALAWQADGRGGFAAGTATAGFAVAPVRVAAV